MFVIEGRENSYCNKYFTHYNSQVYDDTPCFHTTSNVSKNYFSTQKWMNRGKQGDYGITFIFSKLVDPNVSF